MLVYVTLFLLNYRIYYPRCRLVYFCAKEFRIPSNGCHKIRWMFVFRAIFGIFTPGRLLLTLPCQIATGSEELLTC